MKAREHESTRTRRREFCVAFAFMLLCFFVLTVPAFAASDLGLTPIAETSGLGTVDIRVTVGRVINVFLGLLGTIGIVLVLYGGFVWMTAAGNEKKIETAKNILKNAGIGLAIVLSAFGITRFVLSALIGGTTGSGTTSGSDSRFVPGGGFRGTLGGGIVDEHIPRRNATNVARNTNIVITFNESLALPTVINANDATNLMDDTINVANVKIRRTVDDPPDPEDFLTNVQVTNVLTSDGKHMLVLNPSALLGSPSEDVSYTIRFDEGIRKANGDRAFGELNDPYYEWSFTVGTFVDETPPKIVSVIPLEDATHPRNIIIQVNFDEPIDPTVVAGRESRSRVVIEAAGGRRLAGTVRVGNMYQTLEFTTETDDPSSACGTNSCGGLVYCLPYIAENPRIAVLVPTATVGAEAPTAVLTPQGYDGVVDLAANALDGDEDGRAEGSPTDDKEWSFLTDDSIRLEPPTIVSVNPARHAERMAITSIPRAIFSEQLSIAGLSDHVGITPLENHWPTLEGGTMLELRHDPFRAEASYTPTLRSGLKDIYQNCYAPCADSGDRAVCVGSGWSQEYPSCPARL